MVKCGRTRTAVKAAIKKDGAHRRRSRPRSTLGVRRWRARGRVSGDEDGRGAAAAKTTINRVGSDRAKTEAGLKKGK
jgi:hypothetical protein